MNPILKFRLSSLKSINSSQNEQELATLLALIKNLVDLQQLSYHPKFPFVLWYKGGGVVRKFDIEIPALNSNLTDSISRVIAKGGSSGKY